MKQLDWYRNSSYQSKDIAHVQKTITQRFADKVSTCMSRSPCNCSTLPADLLPGCALPALAGALAHKRLTACQDRVGHDLLLSHARRLQGLHGCKMQTSLQIVGSPAAVLECALTKCMQSGTLNKVVLCAAGAVQQQPLVPLLCATDSSWPPQRWRGRGCHQAWHPEHHAGERHQGGTQAGEGCCTAGSCFAGARARCMASPGPEGVGLKEGTDSNPALQATGHQHLVSD